MSTAVTVRRAVLFAALEQIAKHHTSRDLLVDDSMTKVDLTIKGQVKTFAVQESFAGQLIVGPPSTRSTSVACDQVELLSVLASKLSDLLPEPRKSEPPIEKTQKSQRLTIYEETQGRDNDLWDVIVGYHVGASMQGIQRDVCAGGKPPTPKTKRRRSSVTPLAM